MSSNFSKEDNINAESIDDVKDESIDEVTSVQPNDTGDLSDDFDDLSVIDISSDVEYQLNQERTGVSVVKLEKNQSLRKINGFDLFFIKLWAAIVSAISFISASISKGFFKLFKKELPTRYITALISLVLIILLIILILAPFNLTVGDSNKVNLFSNSLMPVAKKDTDGETYWGYVNKSGRLVIPCKFYTADPFYHNVAFVQTDNTTWRLLGTNGKYKGNLVVKTDSNYPDRKVVGDFNNNQQKAWIIVNGKYNFVKTNGSKAFGGYDYAESYSDGYAMVQQGSAWYFINGSGKTKSVSYVEAKSFSEGIAAVKKITGWTFVTTKFKEITDATYDAVTSFHNGYAWVRNGNAINLIDKKGKTILPNDYEGLKPSDEELLELGFELGEKKI